MPDSPDWKIEKLAKQHIREKFACGVDQLDEYLKQYARQNEKSGASQAFVAVASDDVVAFDSIVLGYYTLSAGAVEFDDIPEELKKRLPRYPIPVAHIGRLAVDRSAQGRGLGEFLLLDALARVIRVSDQIGIVAVEVFATNVAAKRFYEKYGFVSLLDNEQHMYISLKAIRKLSLC